MTREHEIIGQFTTKLTSEGAEVTWKHDSTSPVTVLRLYVRIDRWGVDRAFPRYEFGELTTEQVVMLCQEMIRVLTEAKREQPH